MPIEILFYHDTLEDQGRLYYDSYFYSSFKNKGHGFQSDLLHFGASFFSSRRLFILDLFAFQINRNNKIELCLSSKTGKTAKILEIFSKFKKPKFWVLGNVIMKAHAKSQEASSIGNTQKSRGTVQ